MKHNPFIAILTLAFLFSMAPGLTPGGTGKAWGADVTVSGELRVRPEMRENSDFNSSNDDKSGFWGSRTRVNIGVAVDEGTSAKIVLQDARYWGQLANNVQSGREKEAVDIYEAYFEMKSIGESPVGIKLGRQALVYGDQRLLGHLGWQDNARAHDALKLMIGLGSVKVDLFTAKESDPALHTSDATHDDDLSGAYAVVGLGEGISLDVYGLLWKTASTKTNEDQSTTAIKGKNIMTYGARLAVKAGALDATAEAAVQSGDWADGVTQSAMAFAVTAGYKLDVLGGTRIGVEYDSGSGDDNPGDKEHKTFVFPFHTNHAHYGFMDYFSWGNMTDIAVKLSTGPIVGGVALKVDYHMFSLAQAKDSWLNVVGTADFKKAVDSSTSTEAGTEIDVTLIKKMTDSWKLVAGYSTFMPGKAAKDRSGGKGDASTWGYLESSFTF